MSLMADWSLPRSPGKHPLSSRGALVETLPPERAFHRTERGASDFRTRWSRSIVTNLPLLLGDVLLLVAGLAAAFELALVLSGAARDWRQLMKYDVAAAACYLVAARVFHVHRGTAVHPMIEFRQLVLAVAGTHVLLAALAGTFGKLATVELAALAGSAAVAVFALPIGRSCLRSMLGETTWWGERAVVIASGEDRYSLCEFIEDHPERGLKLLGSVELSRIRKGSDESHVASELERQIRHAIPDWVVIAGTPADDGSVREILAHLGNVPNLVVLDTVASLPALDASPFECDGRLGLHVRMTLTSTTVAAAKRAIDILGAALIGLLSLPLMLAIAAWIRLSSPGPVLYRQERVGRGGTRFILYKFRTMVRDADQVLDRHLDNHAGHRAEWRRAHKLRRDPRIVKGIGGILRRTSLDELPQLWNVLKGEMSLIGPRPIVADELRRYHEWTSLYLAVRPGMTGLWQVSGRNALTYEERVRLDSCYVLNWSPWMDAYILLRTVPVVAFCRDAF